MLVEASTGLDGAEMLWKVGGEQQGLLGAGRQPLSQVVKVGVWLVIFCFPLLFGNSLSIILLHLIGLCRCN